MEARDKIVSVVVAVIAGALCGSLAYTAAVNSTPTNALNGCYMKTTRPPSRSR
jgi:hypothetical protein